MDFMVGTCSGKAALRKTSTTPRKNSNGPSWTFGILQPPCIRMSLVCTFRSYRYTYPFINAAYLQGASGSTLKIAIAGREHSLFFKTTCSYGAQYAAALGMDVVMLETYDSAYANNAAFQKNISKRIADLQPDLVIGCIGNTEANVV